MIVSQPLQFLTTSSSSGKRCKASVFSQLLQALSSSLVKAVRLVITEKSRAGVTDGPAVHGEIARACSSQGGPVSSLLTSNALHRIHASIKQPAQSLDWSAEPLMRQSTIYCIARLSMTSFTAVCSTGLWKTLYLSMRGRQVLVPNTSQLRTSNHASLGRQEMRDTSRSGLTLSSCSSSLCSPVGQWHNSAARLYVRKLSLVSAGRLQSNGLLFTILNGVQYIM